MLELKEIIDYLPYELKFYDLLDKEVVSVYSLHPPKDTFDSPTFWMKYPREADEPIFHRRVLDWRAYKPLLLPPSEMSDEQLIELGGILRNNEFDNEELIKLSKHFIELQLDAEYVHIDITFKNVIRMFDFFHANMIDYRNLIERGDAKNVREYE